MTSQLNKILAATRRGVEERRAAHPRPELERKAAEHRPRGFAQALRREAEKGFVVIAELKKASPSRGLIRRDFDVSSLARTLAGNGAAALSVLTDEPFFQGSLENLELASEATRLPCLRKDFMIDEFQILEARAHRADAILLIAAALTDGEMRTLASSAHSFEMDILCEVHTGEELDRVLSLPLDCQAIGVNNRDLRNFEVRIETSLALADRLPSGILRVTESGIDGAEEIVRLRGAGFQAFLIGEHLMRQPDPGEALSRLRGEVDERARTVQSGREAALNVWS